MKNLRRIGFSVSIPVLLIAVGLTSAAGSPKLAAPVYKGAVPAIPADGIKPMPPDPGIFGGVKALDCSADRYGQGNTGPWCFLTRDPIDKVKAFYDKAVGPMHVITGSWGQHPPVPVQGYAVYAERAWFPGYGETSAPGFGYTGVSLHALPAPPVRGKETARNSEDSWQVQDAYKFYAQTRHFNGFVDGVDWFGDPSKRKPAELDAVYKQHSRLESALFQRKGPKSEPVDETLRARFSEQRKQGMEKAYRAMVPGQTQIEQMRQAAQTPMPANQHATPEDAEFTAFMKRNPEVARKYVGLTKKFGTLMQQGKFDEADAVDEELQKLIQSHPELAALERRANERSAAASAAGQAQENQALAAQANQLDQAIWGTWLAYIDAAEKEAYGTLIVIDSAFRGDEKNYSRDRALIAKETAGMVPHPQVFGFHYDRKPQQEGQASTPTVTPPQSPPEPKDDLKGAAKKGLNALKKLF